jgi:hypothetical protein
VPNIKGPSLIEIVKVLRKNKPITKSFIPQDLHHYLHERLLASEWYPEEDYKTLLLVLGQILEPLMPGNVWEFIGHEGARADLTGVHSALVKKGDPWGTLRLTPRIWSLYHDTGRLEADVTEDQATIRLYDYVTACPEVCATLTGYFKGLLQFSGAQVVEADLVECPPPAEGPSVWKVRFRVG